MSALEYARKVLGAGTILANASHEFSLADWLTGWNGRFDSTGKPKPRGMDGRRQCASWADGMLAGALPA